MLSKENSARKVYVSAHMAVSLAILEFETTAAEKLFTAAFNILVHS